MSNIDYEGLYYEECVKSATMKNRLFAAGLGITEPKRTMGTIDVGTMWELRNEMLEGLAKSAKVDRDKWKRNYEAQVDEGMALRNDFYESREKAAYWKETAERNAKRRRAAGEKVERLEAELAEAKEIAGFNAKGERAADQEVERLRAELSTAQEGFAWTRNWKEYVQHLQAINETLTRENKELRGASFKDKWEHCEEELEKSSLTISNLQGENARIEVDLGDLKAAVAREKARADDHFKAAQKYRNEMNDAIETLGGTIF